MKNIKLVLKKNKEFSILKGHPWVFAQAVQVVDTNLKTGDSVAIYSHKDIFLGLGYADTASPILVRMVQGEHKTDLRTNIVACIKRAIAHRKLFFSTATTNAFRIINGEGDGLPGLIVDKYSFAISLQIYSKGLEPFLPIILSELLSHYPEVKWVYRRDSIRNAKTGAAQLLFGKNMPNKIEFLENGLKFATDLINGQKTGFFLDQRANRDLIRSISKKSRILNLCGYTGAFTVAAAAGGAVSSVTVDIAKPALEEAKQNLRLNNFSESAHTLVCADMYDYLAKCPDESFDIVILDPPSMAKNKADHEKALRAYKKLNLLGTKVVKSGGYLFTASCTGHISRSDFLDVVREAIGASGRVATILKETYHDFDHPIALGHPEGAYLKGILLRVV